MSLPPQFLDEIRLRLTLSEAIGRHIAVKRAGREFKACCPFHHEKTPSFTINDAKGFFHCFGCGAHGDIIAFTMRYENLSFPETVERLAGEAGLDVPKPSREAVRREEQRRTLFDLVAQTAEFFSAQLMAPVGRTARDYAERRGLGPNAMARHRLGYAPADAQALPTHLRGLGWSNEQMVAAGVARISDSGRIASFFRDRLMFPVADLRGRLVAFGGRRLGEDGPKYINTGETELFHKGSLLYGMERARTAARDGQPLLVVEGYMDVISLVEAGFEGALAPLGTALTEEQLLVLWKLDPQARQLPVLCFDGDNAGRRAALRGMERALPMLTGTRTLAIAYLPSGEDPDSLVRAAGPTGFQQVLDGAMPLVEALWRAHVEGQRFETPEARAQLQHTLDEATARIADGTLQRFYRQALRDKLYEHFRPAPQQRGQKGAQAAGASGRKGQKAPPAPAIQRRRPTAANAALLQARILLACLINHPQLFDAVEDRIAQVRFAAPALDNLRQAIVRCLSVQPGLDGETLCAHLKAAGFGAELDAVLGASTLEHAAFAGQDQDPAVVEHGFRHVWQLMDKARAIAEMQRTGRTMALEEAPLDRLGALHREVLDRARSSLDD